MAIITLQTKRSESSVGFFYVNERDVNIGDILTIPLRPCNRSGARIPLLKAKYFISKGEMQVSWQREAGEFHIYPPDAFMICDESCLKLEMGYGRYFLKKVEA